MKQNWFVLAASAVIFAMVCQIAIAQEIPFPGQESATPVAISREEAEMRVLRMALEKEMKAVEVGMGSLQRIRRLRLHLARAGDTEERTRIFTALKSPVGAERIAAFEDTAAIGDREAIVQLASLLEDSTSGGRMTYRQKDGTIAVVRDVIIDPPRFMAAQKLAEIIETPPVPPLGTEKCYYTEEDVEAWRMWWEENRNLFLEKSAQENQNTQVGLQ